METPTLPKRDLELRKELFEKSEEKRKNNMISDDFFNHKSNRRKLEKLVFPATAEIMDDIAVAFGDFK